MSERLVTSFRINSSLFDRWRALAVSKNWSMRQRLIDWITKDLQEYGIDIPPQAPRKGWWGTFPQINGKALAKAREEADLSQSKLAKAINTWPSTISRYESNSTQYISLTQVEQLATILGVKTESLLK